MRSLKKKRGATLGRECQGWDNCSSVQLLKRSNEIQRKRIEELEANNGSRWHDLFGTPERAARTLMAVHDVCESGGPCSTNCPFGDAPACPSNFEPRDYDALLEWVRGDAE